VQRRTLASVVMAVSLCGMSSVSTPAPAPVAPVSENFFGHTVVDRYRYFENDHDPRTEKFYTTQNAYARNVLESIGEPRERLARRIRELDRASISVGDVQRVGHYYFFKRQDPHDESEKLYVREAEGGQARLLVDPMAGVAKGARHRTLDWFVPSLDGSSVAFGISTGGSESSVLHVIDTATGRVGKEHIDRTRFGATGWLPGSHAFFYLRLPVTTASTPVTERERNARVYLHRLGEDASRDRPVFGNGVDPSIAVNPDDVANLSISPHSPYVIADIQHGVSNEQTYLAATIAGILSGKPNWVKLAGISDEVTQADVRGSTIYFLSHKNAPNFKVYAVNIAHPGPAETKLVVPEGPSVIQQLGVAQDALYLRVLDAGIGHLLRLQFPTVTNVPGTPAAIHQHGLMPIHLPFQGAIVGMTTDPRISGVTFGLTGWTKSLLWYRTDGKMPIVDTKLKPVSPVDARAYTSIEVKATSADGTEIPLSIIMKRGTALDGSHPAYLEGYGAYGLTLDPYFSATRIAWLERGGVYAIAHVRGGGELGEAWHQAAKRENKVRSIQDYIACAKYLIDHGYTAPDHLAGEGTSAGGIVIGGAITRRPDLFGAALDVVGVSNSLRSEFTANGPSNIPEFGTVKNEKEFLSLRATDAYQRVRDNTSYPAVMLITGRNDPRVPSWELAKFAARLQAATTSGRPVLLRVDNDGGHGFFASSRSQSESLLTDEYSFLLWQLGDAEFAPTSSTQAVPEATEPAPEATSTPTESSEEVGEPGPTPVETDPPLSTPTPTAHAAPDDSPDF
jgi:prolyl oligopeptidase